VSFYGLVKAFTFFPRSVREEGMEADESFRNQQRITDEVLGKKEEGGGDYR
jgi:hypothetical protein